MDQELTTTLKDATDNLRKLFEADLRVIGVRIDCIEKSTTSFEDRITRVPTEVDKQVGHLRELLMSEIDNMKQMVLGIHGRIDRQLKEIEERSETYARNRRESVTATFASQRELNDAHDRASAEAITKAEIATKDQIKALSDIRESTTKALEQKIEDSNKRFETILATLTSRMDRSEGNMLGAQHNRDDARGNIMLAISVGVFILGIGGALVTVVSNINNRSPIPVYAPPPYAPQSYTPSPSQPAQPQISVVPVVPVPVPK